MAANLAAAALFVKALLSVLYEYRWYFPLNFEESAFLIGREDTFRGIYPFAFYTHIVAGPFALTCGAWLMWSANRLEMRSVHRRLGRVQVFLIACVGVSGFLMASRAFAGPIAAAGFACLAIATCGIAVAMVWFVLNRRLREHEIWAARCFLMLCSPLIFRIVSGVLQVTRLDTDGTYQLNAWLSWIIPLLIYEVWLTRSMVTPKAFWNPTHLFSKGVSE